MKKLVEFIKQGTAFAVISHTSPDGDTMGSAAALIYALHTLGKQAKWFCDGEVPHDFMNLEQIASLVEKNDLKILRFESATKEWLDFIFKNRKSNDLLHEYDIVIGPVANDNLYQVISGYEDGIYNLNETIKRLKTYTLTNQISFHTAKALKCIKYMKTIKMGDGDKDE